jgi:hypothetical protein
MQLLREILEGAEMAVPTDEMVGDVEVRQSDKLVGDLPEDLRKLYAFYSNLVDKTNRTIDQLKQKFREVIAANIVTRNRAAIDEAKKALDQQIELFRLKTDLVSDIFFTSVRQAFPEIASEPEIGLRAGWKVVLLNGKHNERCDTCPYRIICPMAGDGCSSQSSLSALASLLGAGLRRRYPG